jgi:hypothetical protein
MSPKKISMCFKGNEHQSNTMPGNRASRDRLGCPENRYNSVIDLMRKYHSDREIGCPAIGEGARKIPCLEIGPHAIG